MSYKIEIRQERAYPIVMCDYCKQPIISGQDGNALWLESMGKAPKSRLYDISHTHKSCNRDFEKLNPPANDEHWMSNGLNHNLFMLLLNVGYDAKAAKHQAELLSGFD